MKLIKASYNIIEQQPGLEGIYKQIELAGRTCYKSESNITEDSAKGFIDRMIKSGHGAMLEHGTVYLAIPEWDERGMPIFPDSLADNPYTKSCLAYSIWHVTTNYRVLVENNLLEYLKYLCEPTEFHEKRVTVRFITDQGVLREFTRHRSMSFAVESTRYCDYSKNKFNNELTFILPPWINETDLPKDTVWCQDDWGKLFYEYYFEPTDKGKEEWGLTDRDVRNFVYAASVCEQIYLTLIKGGWKPQQARNILPLATKCEIVMTGFISDWKHFFNLRHFGTTGAPHPQAKELAEPLYNEFIERGYVTE